MTQYAFKRNQGIIGSCKSHKDRSTIRCGQKKRDKWSNNDLQHTENYRL